MGQAFENNTISIPQPRPLLNTDIVVPFSIVGDEGFPLKSYLMRPYARRNLQGNEQRVFNYRLSRARWIIENAFGILAARWRILEKPISMKLRTTETILHDIQAITCLHNYIITTGFNDNCYLHEGIADREGPNGKLIEGSWRSLTLQHPVLNRMGRIGANIGSIAAMKQRDSLGQYFVSDEGSIPVAVGNDIMINK